MPMRPVALCSACGHQTPCAQHPPRTREKHALYNTARWRRFRLIILNDRPVCEYCQRRGYLTASNEVHHRIALKAGGAPLDPNNVDALCKPCHSRETSQGR